MIHNRYYNYIFNSIFYINDYYLFLYIMIMKFNILDKVKQKSTWLKLTIHSIKEIDWKYYYDWIIESDLILFDYL